MNDILDATKLHSCLLLIATEIHRICEKNGLQCFLIGGSLLGAVRHKGFIPWDDDFDFGLLREDYNKFAEICKMELDQKFVCHYMQDTPNYGFPFIKIKLKETHFFEDGNPKECFNGIFVDVFPIDKMPKTRLQQKFQKIRLQFLYGTLKYKSGNRSMKKWKNIIKALVFSTPALQSRQLIARKIEKSQMMYNGKDDSIYYINLCSSYKYGREVFPVSSFSGKLEKIKFETEMFYAPHNPGAVLTLLYGDYMKLPPEEKRCFKHSEYGIDYGPYGK